MHRNVAEGLTYLVAALSTLTMLTFFWTLRLADNPSLQAAAAPPPSPLKFVRRFIAQPRLVLAWVLALGRNGWWVMNFIYTPIYVAGAGYRPEIGGALVSLGLAPMLLVRVWGRIGQIMGTRNLLSVGYGLTGLASLAAAVAAVAGLSLLCMALICFAAFCATMIDGAGNVPFLRAVRHYERAAMTSVFMTFRARAVGAAATVRVRDWRPAGAANGIPLALYPARNVGDRATSRPRAARPRVGTVGGMRLEPWAASDLE